MINYQYNQPSSFLQEIRTFFRQGSALSVFILINTGIWVLIQVIKVFLFFGGIPDREVILNLVLHAFAVPASIPLLAERPWTIFTYMFLHFEFWHLLFNMLWLYWFGKIFNEFLSGRQLVTVYILGGLAGGLLYVLAFNIFPVFESILPISFALGASASVMAIVTAISFFVPDYHLNLLFFGRIKILYLAIALFVFDFFMIPTGNAGGHIAHIGGALFGLIYALVLKTSRTPGRSKSSTDFFRTFSERFTKKAEPYYKPDHSARPVSDDEYNRKKAEHQKKIDQILDKISKGGYDSLTREEKEYLFKSSSKR